MTPFLSSKTCMPEEAGLKYLRCRDEANSVSFNSRLGRNTADPAPAHNTNPPPLIPLRAGEIAPPFSIYLHAISFQSAGRFATLRPQTEGVPLRVVGATPTLGGRLSESSACRGR